MKFPEILVFILIFLPLQTVGNEEEKVHILKTFLNAIEQRPTEVVALLCWRKEMYLALIKSNRFTKINIVETQNNEFNIVWRNANRVLYVLDIDCLNKTTNLLTRADQSRLLAAPFRWLILSQSSNETYIKSHFETIKIYTDSDVTVALINSPHVEFIQIYKIKSLESRIFTENIAIWDVKTDKVLKLTHKVAASRRTNLHRIPLTASLVFMQNDSRNHLHDTKNRHIDSITKLNYHLTVHLINLVNGTKKFTAVSTWGHRIANTSNYSGMVGELLNGTADIGGTPLFISKERLLLLDYIAPTSKTKVHFIFRQPPLTSVANVLILPFSTSVWLASMALTVAIIPLFYFTVLWERKIYNTIKSEEPEYFNLNFFEVILLSLAAICQQGAHVEPRSPSGRITQFFLFVVFMFLYTAYSAYIVALIQSTSPSIQTLSDLLNSRVKLGVHDVVYNRVLFSHIDSEDSIRRAILDRKITPPGGKAQFFELNEGIRKIQHEFFAFHVECGPAYALISDTFLEHEKCGMQEIDFFKLIGPIYAIQKNSTFLEMFKVGMRKMHERGIQDRETKRFYSQKPGCAGQGNAFVSVGLSDISAVVVVFFSGVASALTIFLLEFLYLKHKNTLVTRKKFLQLTWNNGGH